MMVSSVLGLLAAGTSLTVTFTSTGESLVYCAGLLAAYGGNGGESGSFGGLKGVVRETGDRGRARKEPGLQSECEASVSGARRGAEKP